MDKISTGKFFAGLVDSARAQAMSLLKPSISSIHWFSLQSSPRIIMSCFATNEQESIAADHVHQHHAGHFFVYNLSAERLENGKLVKAVHENLFDEQVLEFSLPYHPAQLELILELCKSVSSWLEADPKNIAIVHSLSAGRATMAAACINVFCGFGDSGIEVIERIEASNSRYKHATAAGQQRYARYITDILHIGKLPNEDPLALSNVSFDRVRHAAGTKELVPADRILIQLIKGKQILFSSDWDNVKMHVSQDPVRGGMRIQDVCIGLIGDTVLRVFLGKENLFRFVFHTGFLVPGEIRITADQVDDLNHEKFSLDAGWELKLTFEPVSIFPELDGDIRDYLDNDASRIRSKIAALVTTSPFRKELDKQAKQMASTPPLPYVPHSHNQTSSSAPVLATLPSSKSTASAAPAKQQAGSMLFTDNVDAPHNYSPTSSLRGGSSNHNVPSASAGIAGAAASSSSNSNLLFADTGAASPQFPHSPKPATPLMPSSASVPSLITDATVRLDPLATLGDDIWTAHILPRLDLLSLANTLRVSRAWNTASSHPDPWDHVIRATYQGSAWIRDADSSAKLGRSELRERQQLIRQRWLGAAPIVQQPVQLSPGFSGRVLALATHGPWIAAAGEDPVIRVWNMASSAAIELTGHTEDILSLAFVRQRHETEPWGASASSSSFVLVSGSTDTTARIWGASSGTSARFVLRGHIAEVSSVAACGINLVATAGGDFLLNVWDTETGTLKWSVQEPVAVTAGPFMGLCAPVPGVLAAIVYGNDETPSYKEYNPVSGSVIRVARVVGAPAEDLDSANLLDVVPKARIAGSAMCIAGDSGVTLVRKDATHHFHRSGEASVDRLAAFSCEPSHGYVVAGDRTPALNLFPNPIARVVGPVDAAASVPLPGVPAALICSSWKIVVATESDNKVMCFDLTTA